MSGFGRSAYNALATKHAANIQWTRKPLYISIDAANCLVAAQRELPVKTLFSTNVYWTIIARIAVSSRTCRHCRIMPAPERCGCVLQAVSFSRDIYDRCSRQRMLCLHGPDDIASGELVWTHMDRSSIGMRSNGVADTAKLCFGITPTTKDTGCSPRFAIKPFVRIGRTWSAGTKRSTLRRFLGVHHTGQSKLPSARHGLGWKSDCAFIDRRLVVAAPNLAPPTRTLLRGPFI